MDLEECFKWGELFTLDPDPRSEGMGRRAIFLGLLQEMDKDTLIWKKGDEEQCRWIFIEDPTNIEAIRSIYLNDKNVNSPSCYLVVRQNDPSDTRGDILFDIFRMNAQSYLWHFNRVFTKPKFKMN